MTWSSYLTFCWPGIWNALTKWQILKIRPGMYTIENEGLSILLLDTLFVFSYDPLMYLLFLKHWKSGDLRHLMKALKNNILQCRKGTLDTKSRTSILTSLKSLWKVTSGGGQGQARWKQWKKGPRCSKKILKWDFREWRSPQFLLQISNKKKST